VVNYHRVMKSEPQMSSCQKAIGITGIFGKSHIATQTKMNDLTQSEQIVVNCSDWVGLFYP